MLGAILHIVQNASVNLVLGKPAISASRHANGTQLREIERLGLFDVQSPSHGVVVFQKLVRAFSELICTMNECLDLQPTVSIMYQYCRWTIASKEAPTKPFQRANSFRSGDVSSPYFIFPHTFPPFRHRFPSNLQETNIIGHFFHWVFTLIPSLSG